MWINYLIAKDPEALVGVITDDDVLKVCKSIQEEDNEYILSRVSFELSLSGDSGEHPHDAPTKEPLASFIWDIIYEEYGYKQQTNGIQDKVQKLALYTQHINSILGCPEVDMILREVRGMDDSKIDTTKYVIQALHKEAEYLKSDVKKIRKDRHQGRTISYGPLGMYKRYILKTAQLYTDLTEKKFEANIHIDSKMRTAGCLSDGAKFSYECHLVLNKCLDEFRIKSFSDRQFKTACDDVRKNLNKKINKN